MKILATVAGRPGGNCEIMAKEALRTAETEFGAEVALVLLRKHNILPCCGCMSCLDGFINGTNHCCVLRGKDDMDAIMEEYRTADGLIHVAPTYMLQPDGTYINFINRFLPYERAYLELAGEGGPKQVGAAICVGASAPQWQTAALACMKLPMTTLSIKCVDQHMVVGAQKKGQVALHTQDLEAARRIGRNVARACQQAYEEVQWLGPKDGWCPVCHSNFMVKRNVQGNWRYECGMCGVYGKLVDGAEGLTLELAENAMDDCRIFTESRMKHLMDARAGKDEGDAYRLTIREALRHYEAYKPRSI